MRKLTIKKSIIAFIAIGATVATGASSCATSNEPSAQRREDTSREQTYTNLVQTQPVHSGSYSPTRNTKNFWIDTWMQHPGKVAYVYLMNSSGKVFGYFVLDGLPVSYCTSIIPPYKIIHDGYPQSGAAFAVPGPSVDGTYSSSSNCDEMYGKDAVTGAYVEFKAGMGINPLIFSQPMPQYGDAKPLGPGTIAKAKKQG